MFQEWSVFRQNVLWSVEYSETAECSLKPSDRSSFRGTGKRNRERSFVRRNVRFRAQELSRIFLTLQMSFPLRLNLSTPESREFIANMMAQTNPDRFPPTPPPNEGILVPESPEVPATPPYRPLSPAPTSTPVDPAPAPSGASSSRVPIFDPVCFRCGLCAVRECACTHCSRIVLVTCLACIRAGYPQIRTATIVRDEHHSFDVRGRE